MRLVVRWLRAAKLQTRLDNEVIDVSNGRTGAAPRIGLAVCAITAHSAAATNPGCRAYWSPQDSAIG